MEKKKNDYREYLKVPIRNDRKPLHELLPLDQPLRVLIDPCDICNFRCDFCFQSKKSFTGTKMAPQIFDTIVEQLMEFEKPINVVHMYGLGEPLINEHLPEYIAKLKEKNVAKEVAITTNGSLLTEKLSSQLVAAGLDRLSISLNGISDEHFKCISGVNMNFGSMYKQIRHFYNIRQKCHLHVKINGDYFTEREKERFVNLFKDCTDSLNIDHAVNVWPGLEVTKNKVYRMYDYDLDNLNVKESEGKAVCPLMFYEVLIHCDGSVSPCAVDYQYKNENLGNILTQTIKSIWNSNRLSEMRVQALKGERIRYSACNNCQYTECAATVNITPYRNELLKKF